MIHILNRNMNILQKLEHLMKIHDHCSFKTIANIFYKHNVHPLLNTQKILIN